MSGILFILNTTNTIADVRYIWHMLVVVGRFVAFVTSSLSLIAFVGASVGCHLPKAVNGSVDEYVFVPQTRRTI